MDSLKETIAIEFRKILKARGLTVSAAAKSLGISRQALHSHLNGNSTPRASVLARAAELWSLEIRVGKQVYEGEHFTQPRSVKSVPQQLELWRQLDSIQEKDLRIGVRRVGKKLRVSVEIAIPA